MWLIGAGLASFQFCVWGLNHFVKKKQKNNKNLSETVGQITLTYAVNILPTAGLVSSFTGPVWCTSFNQFHFIRYD